MMWFSSSVRACRTASCLVAAFLLSTIHVTRSQPRNTSRYRWPSTLRLCFKHVPVSTSLQRPNTCFCRILFSKLCHHLYVAVPLCHIRYMVCLCWLDMQICGCTFCFFPFLPIYSLPVEHLCVFFFTISVPNHDFQVDFVHLHSNLYVTLWI